MLTTNHISNLLGSCRSWLSDPEEPGASNATKGEQTIQRMRDVFSRTTAWIDYAGMAEFMGMSKVQCSVIAKELVERGFLIRREEKRGKCSRAIVYRRAS